MKFFLYGNPECLHHQGMMQLKWGFDVVNYEEFLGVPGTLML
jgi:hypothetical protein